MRIIILCLSILGSVTLIYAQNEKLHLLKKRVDASLPFYEITQMSCFRGDHYLTPTREKYERQKNKEGPLLTLNTHDKFSLLDGTISDKVENNQSLMERFNIYVYQKNLPSHWNATTFKVFLQEKNWKEQKDVLTKTIEEKLQQQFPTYRLTVESSISIEKSTTILVINISSNTGGDEFETTSDERERCKNMSLEIKPVLNSLLNELHFKRLIKLRKEVIEPYRENIRKNHHTQKLHTFKFDIEESGKYNADKKQFQYTKVSEGWMLKYIGAPMDKAKILKSNPKEYQFQVHIFEGQMSTPWCPNKDRTAFGFYEIVHKETQNLFLRTYASFYQSSDQAYYKYTLTFP